MRRESGMLRALFVTGSLVHGGAERHAITLMNRLVERGHECHAIYVKDDPSQLKRIKLGHTGVVACLHARRYLDVGAVARFADHLKTLRPHVIVAANAYALTYAKLALWRAGLSIPLVVVFHSTRLVGWKEQVKMLVERFFFAAADCLVYVCDAQRRHWQRRGLVARRDEVILNGVDVEHFRPDSVSAMPNGVRRDYGIAAGDFVIGLPAVLRPEKNHVLLVEAVAALRLRGIPAVALLIGDGDLRPQIEARARALGVSRHVVITGFRQEVRPELLACDVVVLCSTTEALSLAALEAMAMGRPVVHSDVGGAREIIRDGHNGFVFPAADLNAFVDCLSRLADRGAAADMGRAARRMAELSFAESAMVDRYEQLLLDLGSRDAGRQPRDRPVGARLLSRTQDRQGEKL